MTVDYVKYDLAAFLARHKSLAYREGVLRDARTLMNFLVAHDLVTVDPFDAQGQLRHDLVLRQSDLTATGVALFAGPIKTWWARIDRGGDPSNTDLLAQGLSQASPPADQAGACAALPSRNKPPPSR